MTRDDALYFQNKIICSEIELVYNVIQLYKCVILRIKIQKLNNFVMMTHNFLGVLTEIWRCNSMQNTNYQEGSMPCQNYL